MERVYNKDILRTKPLQWVGHNSEPIQDVHFQRFCPSPKQSVYGWSLLKLLVSSWVISLMTVWQAEGLIKATGSASPYWLHYLQKKLPHKAIWNIEVSVYKVRTRHQQQERNLGQAENADSQGPLSHLNKIPTDSHTSFWYNSSLGTPACFVITHTKQFSVKPSSRQHSVIA